MRRALLSCALLLAPLAGGAQEDDKGYLTSFLEENLSGAGRSVVIDGFAGALSSRATFDRLTIADDRGIWITIDKGAIQWSRSALLSGRVEIQELSAARIDLARAPAMSAGGTTPEAVPFALPELPVSVAIGQLKSPDVHLGTEVLGQELDVAFDGAATLSGGEGAARLTMERADGAEGSLTLSADYSNATRAATIDLLASEAAGGIAATLLHLPGQPSARLALHGSGPIDDFTTELALETDGKPRLTGRATLKASAGTPPAAAATARNFALQLQGDISPLLAQDYRDFFGDHVSLQADGALHPDGRTDLTRFVLGAAGLDLTGRLSLSPDRVPTAAALTLRMGLPGADAGPMRLPLAGAPAFVDSALVRLRFDGAKGPDWTLAGDLQNYRRDGLAIENLTLDGSGRIDTATAALTGQTRFAAKGLALDDPALAAAVGPEISGSLGFDRPPGQALHLSDIQATAGDLQMEGQIDLSRQGLDPVATGTLQLKAASLARFSALAGRDLGGRAMISAKGYYQLLSGAFDLDAHATGSGLSVAQPMADRLLSDASDISLSARRDAEGLTLRRLDLKAKSLTGQASGSLTSRTQSLTGQVSMGDLGDLAERFGGALTAAITVEGAPGARHLTLSGTGQGLTVGDATADKLLSGRAELTASADETPQGLRLTDGTVRTGQVTLDLTAADQGLALSGRLENLGSIAPGFPGSVTLKGTVDPYVDPMPLNVAGTGPGGIALTLQGHVARDMASADLALTGTAQAGLLNARLAPRSLSGQVVADLRLNGPLSPRSLTGTLRADGLRVASPHERIATEPGQLTATLSDGRALVRGETALRGGGQVTVEGPVDLAPPFDGDLAVRLTSARLRDPALYDTRVTGQLRINGPLFTAPIVSGAVTLEDTEITIAAPSLASAPPPGIRHLNESAASQATRRRAGLADGADGGADRRHPVALDLTVSAPARIFVRGYGVDAELGGTVHLGGTTEAAVPAGQFSLIRGRMTLLGKRFILGEGLVQLQGSLIPWISFSASSDTFGSTATATLEGPANKPELHFTSSSGLPEEEVLSELLFGSRLNGLSAFQLAQMAQALASLSGNGNFDLVTRLRKSAGLDDLDIVADDAGDAALKAGKYLSDKVYGTVSVGSRGKSAVDLNLDLNPDLSVHGTIGTDGQTGAGVLFGHDY